ncbi:hypothetical protein [Dermatophilus congolensis]|uniref:hypothetical protein n=1 Tax=Dermatophilus congolensis TaxID=1863 RepID=UPI000E0FA50D|nr:hypothetical protein [Dermatophilus congolensis]
MTKTPHLNQPSWMSTLVAKNGLTSILLRGVLIPMVLSFAGALFKVFEPAPIRPDTTGDPPDRNAVFLFIDCLLLGQVVVMTLLPVIISHAISGIQCAGAARSRGHRRRDGFTRPRGIELSLNNLQEQAARLNGTFYAALQQYQVGLRTAPPATPQLGRSRPQPSHPARHDWSPLPNHPQPTKHTQPHHDMMKN